MIPDAMELADETLIVANNPALVELLAFYGKAGRNGWTTRRMGEAGSRDPRRLHSQALTLDCLEPSAGNPDAPLELRQSPCYRLTRTGWTMLQTVKAMDNSRASAA